MVSARVPFNRVIVSSSGLRKSLVSASARRSLSDLGGFGEGVGERGRLPGRLRRVVVLFGEKDRINGRLSRFRRQFSLSPTGS